MAAKNPPRSYYQTTPISDDEVRRATRVVAADKQRKRTNKNAALVFQGTRYWKVLTVKFRSHNDLETFAHAIGQTIPISAKGIVFATRPRRGARGSVVGARPIPSPSQQAPNVSWGGMPAFEQEKSRWDAVKLKVYFPTLTAYKQFAYVVRQYVTRTTTSIHYPEWTPSTLKHQRWRSSLPRIKTTPRYPIYIVSRGRAHSRLTAKTLSAMQVPYLLVVEPSEYDTYAAVEDRRRILVLPSDTDPASPTGPGRARNFCRDHAWANGHARHWVMDDNIQGFFRLHRNKRIQVADGAIFRAAEDFVDRYDNVLVAGFQYRHFCASKAKYPPYVANTRIYSCLLIDNTRLFRWAHGTRRQNAEVPVVVTARPRAPMGRMRFLWRERYNEDTILSLDAMENGYATIQFNAFLQGKSGTQQLKGGNTDVFYAVEDAEQEAEEQETYHEAGTVRKSLTLEKVYPSVTKLVHRFKRPHHQVDYRKYQAIPLRLKKHAVVPSAPNDYGMALVTVNERSGALA